VTAEEKKKRREDRAARIELENKRFPEAALLSRNGDLQIRLRRGDGLFLIVRTNNLEDFRPSVIGGDNGWVEDGVFLGDIEALASFTAALVARLNHLIESANENIGKTSVLKLTQPHVEKP